MRAPSPKATRLAPRCLRLVRRTAGRDLWAPGADHERIRIGGDDAHVGEADVIEHGDTTGAVEEPEHGRIEVLALASGQHSVRIEAGPRRALDGRFLVHVGLEQQLSRAHAPNPLEGVLRVLEVVEDAVEEDEIERAQALGVEVVDIHQERRGVRLPGRLEDVEAAYRRREGVDTPGRLEDVEAAYRRREGVDAD